MFKNRLRSAITGIRLSTTILAVTVLTSPLLAKLATTANLTCGSGCSG